MLGGFLVGYTILLLKRYIRLPQSMQGLMPIMVLPVLSTIIGGLLMMTLIGKTHRLVTRSTDSFARVDAGRIALPDGAILGAMATFDFGGPVNKTMSLFFRWLAGQWRLRTRSREICRLNHPSVWHHTFVLTDTP